METVKLSELADVITKGTTPTTLGYAFQSEGINFLKIECFDENGDFLPDKLAFISKDCHDKLKRSQLKSNDIVFSIAGAIGRVAVITKEMLPANTNQALAIIRISRNDIYIPFVKLVLSSSVIKSQFDKQKQGVAQLNISLKNVGELAIPVLNYKDQIRIVQQFEKVSSLINTRKQQLSALDTLIKARFVEMFGDPEINDKNLFNMPMTEVCEIIDGDRGENYPTQDEFSEDGYCLFLNAKNVTCNGFSFEKCMFVTKEKDELLRKGHLHRGDVVLTTRGTIGNLAFYNDSVPFDNIRINSGMVVLRMNHYIVSEQFFIEQFRMLLNSIKEKIASGSAQPQLPISTMNKIVVLMPPLEQQKTFSTFVSRVDQSKAAVKKALDEAQLLFDCLMQKYFG